MIYIIASQLVSLQDVFHLAVQFSKYIQVLAAPFAFARFALRSLKTIQVQEEEQSILSSIDRNLFAFSAFFFLRICYAPNRSLTRFRFLFSVSTWCQASAFLLRLLPRKEVIQPHLPIRLPCYDFTPVIGLTFDGWLLAVTSPASGAPNSHGVTGGVYKARERIHRDMLIRDY